MSGKTVYLWAFLREPSKGRNENRRGSGYLNIRKSEPENQKSETFAIAEDDYLKEVSGFISKDEDSIQCLIFTTFKGEGQKIG